MQVEGGRANPRRLHVKPEGLAIEDLGQVMAFDVGRDHRLFPARIQQVTHHAEGLEVVKPALLKVGNIEDVVQVPEASVSEKRTLIGTEKRNEENHVSRSGWTNEARISIPPER